MKNLEEFTEIETNFIFFQKCLKLLMVFFGVVVNENFRNYGKIYSLLQPFAFASSILPTIGFVLTSDDTEYIIDSLLIAGVILLIHFTVWHLRQKSYHFRQIYQKLMNSEQTSPAFLKICVKNQRKNIFILSVFFGITIGCLLAVIILTLLLSSDFSFGSPSTFLYPVKYPWPMDTAGWYCFTLTINLLVSTPQVCIIIAFAYTVLLWRTIIQSHKYLILVQVKNLDKFGMKRGTTDNVEINKTFWPDKEMQDELRSVIRYHQFFTE